MHNLIFMRRELVSVQKSTGRNYSNSS